jgi:hypothetical protein
MHNKRYKKGWSMFSTKKKFKIVCEKYQNSAETQHNTTHTQTHNLQTWQDIYNGDAQNSSTPRTMPTGWGSQCKLLRPSIPEQGQGPTLPHTFSSPSAVTLFFDSTT